MVSPIFIVGARRTGTTWLGNIICNHSRVAGVQEVSEIRQDGIYESAYFSHLAGKYGDLKDPNNLIRFVEIFASSSYFIKSGLDKEIFYREKPKNCQSLFQLFMEHLAKKQGAEYCVEKTPSHSLHLAEISSYYKQAKFVAIRRNIVDQIKSISKFNEFDDGKNIGWFKRKRLLLKRMMTYHTYYKHILHFIAKQPDKVILIEYAELKKSTKETVSRICKFLGIDFQAEMLEKKYKPNTSFVNNSERMSILSAADEKLVSILNPLFSLLPYALYRFVYLIKKKRERGKLPYWFFLTKRVQYGLTYRQDGHWKRYDSQVWN